MSFIPTPSRADVIAPEFYKRWEKFVRELGEQRGDTVTGPIRLDNSDGATFCMKSVSNVYSGYVMGSCLLLHGTWSADFSGSERDFNEFLGVVRGAAVVVNK